MAERKWDRHEETIALWYKYLHEEDCNDWEITQVFGRIILHLFSCDCTVIPTEKERFNESLSLLDTVPEKDKEILARSIADEMKTGTYDWFAKFAGTRYLDTYAHIHGHLLAVRRGLPPAYCPFKDKR